MTDRGTRLINLTQHPIDLYGDSGTQHPVTVWHEAQPLRLVTSQYLYTKVFLENAYKERVSIPVSTIAHELAPNIVLPTYARDTYYVVPRLVADAMRHRSDLLFPGELVRDPNTSRPVGARALHRFHTMRCPTCGDIMIGTLNESRTADVYKCQSCEYTEVY